MNEIAAMKLRQNYFLHSLSGMEAHKNDVDECLDAAQLSDYQHRQAFMLVFNELRVIRNTLGQKLPCGPYVDFVTFKRIGQTPETLRQPPVVIYDQIPVTESGQRRTRDGQTVPERQDLPLETTLDIQFE